MDILNYLTQDWQALLKIILSDVVLSIDNALVIAMVCAGLKPEHQGTAMKWGMSVAVIARIVFLLVAFILVQIPLLKLFAGLWLVKLGYDMVVSHNESNDGLEQKNTLKSAIIAIVIADIMMSLDNVLAVVGASGEGNHVLYTFHMFGKGFDITDTYPLAILGVLISIPILLFASKSLMKLVEKYPVLNTIGAMLITFIGVEMAIKDELFSNILLKTSNTLGISTGGLVPILGALITFAIYMLFKTILKKKGGK